VTTTRAPAEEFVERFVDVWSAPTAERLTANMAPDVVLKAPATPDICGREVAARMWTGLFRALPDLRGQVHRWAPTEDGVVIELTLSATVARRRFSWPLVDWVRLNDDGLIRERVSYFDPLPLTLEMLKAPRRWPAFARLVRPRGVRAAAR
jgi:ketosteroid isomerase-like protein